MIAMQLKPCGNGRWKSKLPLQMEPAGPEQPFSGLMYSELKDSQRYKCSLGFQGYSSDTMTATAGITMITEVDTV